MKFRLLSLLGVLAVAMMVTTAPTAAVATQPAVSSVLTPGQTGAADPAQWGGLGYPWMGGGLAWGTSSSSNWSTGACGCPSGVSISPLSPMSGLSGLSGFGGPWWAGMPLGTISASTGGTWPWAPWYWTPWWWTSVALTGGH